MSVEKKDPLNDTFVGAMFDQASLRVPQYKTYIMAAKPYGIMTANALDKSWPYVQQAYDIGYKIYLKMEPYGPQQFLPLLFGLVLCFFGGSYLTLIAAIEAVRMTVWDRLYAAVGVMYQNYLAAYEASKKDDLVDDDGNGIPDVKEMSKNALISRKMYLIAKTVDPNRVSEALGLIWGAMLSVIATLRVQFAQAVTLGISIGGMLHKHFDKQLQPFLLQFLPPDLQKWAPVGSQYICRTIGITFAWFMQRIISGFHSAVRGGNMFVVNAIRLGKKHGYLEDFDEASPKTSMIAGLVALIGFYWQLSNGFALPFPLNLLLLPVTIVEWILEFWVGV